MAWSGDGRMPAVMKQLLEIERSLNNFMLETVLKLQTLTQTKVFLLLESKHYRRYCGNPEMVLCFENSDFQLDAKANQIDIEVTLDPAANTLRENLRKKRRRGHYRVGSALENEVVGVSPPKRSRPNNGHHETAGEATTTANNEDLYIKQELDDDPHFTDDQVNEVLDHFERNDGLEFKRKLSSSTGHLLSALDEDEDENGELEGTEFLGGPPFREGMYSLENITKSQKFRTLEKVQDVSRAYIKGSWEFALLGSTMYDIGNSTRGKRVAMIMPIFTWPSRRDTNARREICHTIGGWVSSSLSSLTLIHLVRFILIPVR